MKTCFLHPKKDSLNCSYEEIKELMNSLPNEVGILLDLGHFNISSNILGFNRHKALDKLVNNFFGRIKRNTHFRK